MKKIQIELLVLNLLAISLLILDILFGPLIIIPLAIFPEPGELVEIPTIFIFYIVLFFFIISILILISDYRKMRIKFEILALPHINVDFIRLKGENIQAIKISAKMARKISSIQDNRIVQEINKKIYEIGSEKQKIREKDGIYIFIGYNDKQKWVYVGQSGRVIKRIGNHEKLETGIYSTILIFTCSGDNFGGSVLRELESRLIISLKEQKNIQVDNFQEKNYTPSDFFDSHIVDRYHYLILETILHYVN